MDSIRLGQAGLVQIDNSEKIVFKIKGKAFRYLFFNISADVIVDRIDLVETVSLKGNQQVVVPVFPIHSQQIAVYHGLFNLRVVQKLFQKILKPQRMSGA